MQNSGNQTHKCDSLSQRDVSQTAAKKIHTIITWDDKSSIVTVSSNNVIERVFGGVVEKAMGYTCSQPLRRVVDFGPCASVPQRRCADGVEIV